MLSQVPKEPQSYHTKLPELSVEEVWGRRVIIPKKLQKILHSEHMGIAKIKALAGSHVWWIGIDKRFGVSCKILSRVCNSS